MADINNYRSRIKIYRRVLTSNSFGGFSQTQTEVDTVWCRITPLTGRESLQYKQVYPTADYRILMRYRPDVNTNYRLFYNNRYMNILSVTDIDNRHDELEILAERKQSEE
jgi:SPP1 family predicted phage head-tail adaptor